MKQSAPRFSFSSLLLWLMLAACIAASAYFLESNGDAVTRFWEYAHEKPIYATLLLTAVFALVFVLFSILKGNKPKREAGEPDRADWASAFDNGDVEEKEDAIALSIRPDPYGDSDVIEAQAQVNAPQMKQARKRDLDNALKASSDRSEESAYARFTLGGKQTIIEPEAEDERQGDESRQKNPKPKKGEGENVIEAQAKESEGNEKSEREQEQAEKPPRKISTMDEIDEVLEPVSLEERLYLKSQFETIIQQETFRKIDETEYRTPPKIRMDAEEASDAFQPIDEPAEFEQAETAKDDAEKVANENREPKLSPRIPRQSGEKIRAEIEAAQKGDIEWALRILGLSGEDLMNAQITEEHLLKIYRLKSQMVHPDRFEGEEDERKAWAKEKMAALNQAKAILFQVIHEED